MHPNSKFILLSVAPVASAGTSIAASGTLIVMILRSPTKLKVPLRRLIFGLCSYDCFYSFGHALTNLPKISGNPHFCTFQAFLIQFGFVGVVSYNTAMSIYYVSVIKFGMSEIAFRQKIEKYLHVVSNLLPITSALFALFADLYGYIGALCWVRAEETLFFRNLLGVIPLGLGFIIMSVNMTLIISAVIRQDRKEKKWKRMNTRRFRFSTCSTSNATTSSIERPAQQHKFDLKAARRASLSYHQASSLAPEDQGGHLQNPSSTCERSTNHLSSPGNIYNNGSNVALNSGPMGHGKGGVIQQRSFELKPVRRATISHFPGYSVEGQPSNVCIPELRSSPGNNFDGRSNATVLNLGATESSHKDVPNQAPTMAFDNLLSLSMNASNVQPISGRNPPLQMTHRGPAQPMRRSSFLLSKNTVASENERAHTHQRPWKRQARLLAISQGLLYIITFFLSFIFTVIFRMSGDNEDLFPILLASRIFTPLQGLMLIMVYCRPHVKALRKRQPELSFVKAFWWVVKSGGDYNSTGQTRADRKTNLRGSKVFLERLQRNHVDRMSILRKTSRVITSNSDQIINQDDAPDHINSLSRKASEVQGDAQSCHKGNKDGEHATSCGNSVPLGNAVEGEFQMHDLGHNFADTCDDPMKAESESEKIESYDLQEKNCDNSNDHGVNNSAKAPVPKKNIEPHCVGEECHDQLYSSNDVDESVRQCKVDACNQWENLTSDVEYQ